MRTGPIFLVLAFAVVNSFAVQPKIKTLLQKGGRIYLEHYEQTETSAAHYNYAYQPYQGRPASTSDRDVATKFALTWDDGKSGHQTDIRTDTQDLYGWWNWTNITTWGVSWWPRLGLGTNWDATTGTSSYDYPPSFYFQYRNDAPKWEYNYFDSNNLGGPATFSGHITQSNYTKLVLKLKTGGMALPKQTNIYYITTTASEVKQTGADSLYHTPIYGSSSIPPTNITVGDLGRLDADGVTYVLIPNNSTKDITPTVVGVPHYTFNIPTVVVYPVISQTACAALRDPNLGRTNLGVGEFVTFGAPTVTGFYPLPDETKWTTSGGGLSDSQGSTTVLTAPSNAPASGNIRVTATIRKASVTMDFKVFEPTGYGGADVVLTSSAPPGTPGAGMHLNVYIGRPDVSFIRVQIFEVPQPASGVDGYFQNHPPTDHDIAHGAGVWHGLFWNSMVADNFDQAQSFPPPAMPGPWGNGGTYTWHVPTQWRVGNNGAVGNMKPWDQVVNLQPNGTVSISKFDHTVTRTINNVITFR